MGEMIWDDECLNEYCEQQSSNDDEQQNHNSPFNFDFLSLLSNPKDYYRILEVNCDATEETIRSNYIHLALKWHPDKHNDNDGATSKFQEISEAYQVGLRLSTLFSPFPSWFWAVLSDPDKRKEYDKKGMMHMCDDNIIEYLDRYKGLILTCNGLGMIHYLWEVTGFLTRGSRCGQVVNLPSLNSDVPVCFSPMLHMLEWVWDLQS